MAKRIDLDNEYIGKEYKLGKSASQIALELGCEKSTICRRLRSIGVKIRDQSIQLDIDKIKYLYNNGLSCAKIGNIMDASESVISSRLNDAGVQKRSGKIDLDKNYIKDLYVRGESIKSISDLFGVSITPITNILNDLGVKRRDRSDCQAPVIDRKIANETYRNKEWLEKQYLINNKSHSQIAKDCGAERYIISWWMRKYNIKGRTRHEQSLLTTKHCQLNNSSRSFIDGLLLGDGSVTSFSSVAAGYGHSEKHEDYLIWLSRMLSSFGINQCGKITFRVEISNGYECPAFHFKTLFYSELLDIRNRWYINMEKHVPSDIQINEIVCMNWYIGDGCLGHQKRGRPWITLSTMGFLKKEVICLIKKLSLVGVVASYQTAHNSIRLNYENTVKFLDYIGECPKEIEHIYGYKFDLTRTKKEWEAEFGI